MLTIDPTKSVFDWANARACAELCDRAYVEPATVFDRVTDAECLIEDHGTFVTLAFKGSKEPQDFIQDAEFWMTETNWSDNCPAHVHHGFWADFKSIIEEIKDELAVIKFKPLFITGHSLGGALAVLTAFELAQSGYNVQAVYTFGCPRIGDSVFGDLYNSYLGDKTFCVVNENDIVPRTPPLLIGYRRVGQKIFLFDPAGWGVNPALWLLLLSDASGFWTAYRKKCDVLVSEHFIRAYQKRIQFL